jgi:hypothetical protein
MIYLEFIDRDRFVPIEVFRYLADQGASWAEGQVDQMILQLGRTLRLGPTPGYLAFWRIPAITRADAWETYFSSDAAFRNRRGSAMHRAIHIQRAGLYDELVAEPVSGDGYWYVEYFDAPPDLDDGAVATPFLARRHTHPEARLCLVLRRLGLLGPDPAHLAVWAFPSYDAMEQIVRAAPLTREVQIKTAGIYRRLGDETI